MMLTFSRKLGDSELSYFLPSRADGVNDMYLHLGFRAPRNLVNPHRVALAWAILRVRHPLLAASVLMEPGAYDTARFVYTPTTSPAASLHEARSTLLLKNAPKDVLIDAYLNGPRTLSHERLSVLIFSSSHPGFPQELGTQASRTGTVTPPPTPRPTTAEFSSTSVRVENPDKICEFNLLFCAAHFLGDGIALHTCVNDLFTLLAAPASVPAVPHPGRSSGSGCSAGIDADTPASGDMTPLSDAALNALLELEWSKRWGDSASYSRFPGAQSCPEVEFASPLPPPLESRLPGTPLSSPHSPSPLSTFQRVAHDLAFRRSQGRLIGGHSFARVRPPCPCSESDKPGTKEADVVHPTGTATPALTATLKTDVLRRQCHTLVRTVAFPPALTRRVLKRCKEEGVSVAHVLFALSNVAWGRVGNPGNGVGWEMPIMMYSALNLRPYLTPAPAPSPCLRPEDASYWFLAVGYFNVVLPAFLLPQDDDASDDSARKTLFHRARLSKRQCASAAKTPFLSAYAQRMARERGERARRFARADDRLEGVSKGTSGGPLAESPKTSGCLTVEQAQVLPSPPITPTGTRASTPPLSTTASGATSLPEKLTESLPENPLVDSKASTSPLPELLRSKNISTPAKASCLKPPSSALLGLSLLGNLDAMYTHSTYAPVTLHTLTTGSRQRTGSQLLFGYTFAGRLWVSLGWDGVTFGGEGREAAQGEEGARGETRGMVWEGLENGGASENKGMSEDEDRRKSGIGMVGGEGELGRWWREVVRGVEEFFGEGESA